MADAPSAPQPPPAATVRWRWLLDGAVGGRRFSVLGSGERRRNVSGFAPSRQIPRPHQTHPPSPCSTPSTSPPQVVAVQTLVVFLIAAASILPRSHPW